MKITKPLYSDNQTGLFAGLGYFAQHKTAHRFVYAPDGTRGRDSTQSASGQRLTNALRTWQQNPRITATPWREYSHNALQTTTSTSEYNKQTNVLTINTTGIKHINRCIINPY